MCALKWYIKSLYRHLFLEDISKHARVTQKWHFVICGKLYSQAPWPQLPKLGVWVAKVPSCDRTDSHSFSGEPPPPPPPWDIELRRGRTTEICRSVDPQGWTSKVTLGWTSKVSLGWTSKVTLGWPSKVTLGWPSKVTLGWPSKVTLGWPSKVILGWPSKFNYL